MTAPRIGLYSGTFDPITLGHVNVLERAARLFDVLYLAVATAHHKTTLFSLDERMALARASLPTQQIHIIPFDGLVVDCCREVGAQTIVRGVRNGSDMDYESQMAQMNRKLDAHIDTLFMLPDPSVQCISSTLVREISRLGGDISHLVPAPVASALQALHARKP